MSFRTTIILLVLVAGVGVAAWLLKPRVDEARLEGGVSKPPAGESKAVFDPAPKDAEVTRVTLERAGKPRMVFERGPKPDKPEQMDDWKMTEPLAAPCENWQVNNLLNVARVQSRGGFEPGKGGAVALDATGLAPPAAVLTLTQRDGKEFKLEVGRKAAMSDDTYVRVAGQTTVHRASRDLGRDVEKEPKDFRSKRLVNVAADNAKRMTIASEGVTYELSKGDDGGWLVLSPVKAYALKDKVLAAVRAANALTIDEFVDDHPSDLEKFGLAVPASRIVIETEQKKPLPADPAATQPAEPTYELVKATTSIDVGGFADIKEQKRYAKLADQPWVVTVSVSNLSGLKPNLKEWRDPVVTRVKAPQATEVEVTLGGETALLKKVDNVWTGTGDLEQLDREAVTQLVEAFEDVRAVDWIDAPEPLSAYELDPPRGAIRVTTSAAVAPVTLRIGRLTPSGRTAYAQVEGQPGVVVIDAEHAGRLAVAPLALRSRTIVSVPGGSVKSVDVTRGSQHYVVAREGSDWKMSEPPGATADASGMNDLARDLLNLKARRAVSRGEYEKYGLSDPVATLRFVVEAPPPVSSAPATSGESQPAPVEPRRSEHTLVVGKVGEVPYARHGDDPYVFELDPTVFRVLTGELIQRRLFTFKESDVVRFEASSPTGQLKLARQQDKWIFKPDPYVELDQKKVKDFLTELSGFGVDTYLAYSGGDPAAHGLGDARITVTIGLASGDAIELKLDAERRGVMPRKAAIPALGRIFLMRPADAEKLVRNLDYYVKSGKEEKPPPSEEEEMGLPGGHDHDHGE